MDSLKLLETQIFSIRELVENFESKSHTDEDLIKFMLEYHKLENEILFTFKNDNPNEDDSSAEKIENLINIFNTYWQNYQDKWSDKFWEVYESLHKNKVESGQQEISHILFEGDNKVLFNDDSIIVKNFDNKVENINNFYSKDNMKSNSTNFQTKTHINLHDIDEELDKINEISVIKEKKLNEKKRNCFDCSIF